MYLITMKPIPLRPQGWKYIMCGAGIQLVIQKTADLPSVYGT